MSDRVTRTGGRNKQGSDAGFRRRGREGEVGLPVYLRGIGQHPPLDAVEEEKIREALRNKEPGARDRLIRGGLRHVVSVATWYHKVSRMDLDELIAAGNLGLMEAAERYDPDHGNRFWAYADSWIRRHIQLLFQEMHPALRVPVEVHRYASKIQSENERRAMVGLQRLDFQEAVEFLGVRESTVRWIWRWLGETSGSEPTACSLDDASALPAEQDVAGDSLESCTNSAISRLLAESPLTPREREVLDLLYGLSDGRERTLMEVGEILGVKHQAVRARKMSALERIRRDPMAARLRLYWEEIGSDRGEGRLEEREAAVA